jgi:hypothetical protein
MQEYQIALRETAITKKKTRSENTKKKPWTCVLVFSRVKLLLYCVFKSEKT